jgi:hypothetical protein
MADFFDGGMSKNAEVPIHQSLRGTLLFSRFDRTGMFPEQ